MVTFLTLKNLFWIILRKILALKKPILVRDQFLILPTSSWILLSFQSFRVVVDYMEGNHNCRAYYHGNLSTSVLEERPRKLSKQQRYIKAASIGKGPFYKWRLEVVLFISIRATW